MMKNVVSSICGLVIAAALVTGCGKKPEPKSVSTTSTQTSKQDDTGESTTTDTKTTTTEMPDGSTSVESTQKTNSNVPATAPTTK